MNAEPTRLPVLALVGRPNVGKSTLYNRLTGTRDALVADLPGLTRDRQYGYAQYDGRRFMVVDTGGLFPESDDPMARLAEQQARLAIEDADRVLFLTDARAGLTPKDQAIAATLRKTGKPITLVANKAEGLSRAQLGEFYALGFGEPAAVSAEHGDGIKDLLRTVLGDFPPAPPEQPAAGEATRVAVVGRPNVGKSTLINRLIGEERLVAADQPGTTRDSIQVPFSRDGRDFVLIDTAGVRRKSRVEEHVEKLSIVKTLQAIELAHVVIAVVDAQGDVGEHDARLMGLIANRGRAMVLAVNKWDGLGEDKRREVRDAVDLKLPFLDYVPMHFIAAKHGSGLGELMQGVEDVAQAVHRELPTPELNRVLHEAVERHQPPAVVGRRIKLRYAHQGGKHPTVIVIHGNQTEKLPVAYKRYLANEFRRAFGLAGVPLQLVFKTGENPFRGRRNELSGHQIKKRQRLMQRAKR
ncbi:MAG: ribosome biogenesis GTPase Der [Gammaproteobacteria bacterium]|nr:ribosome biogenesis GTPase Der [Gammaproteobacteria bacterium]